MKPSSLTRVLVALVAIFSAQAGYAAKEYYSISRGTRALGMGNAFYGLSNDENALFYNPAGLSLYRKGTDLMFSLKAEGTTSALSAINVLTTASGQTVSSLVSSLEQFQGAPVSVGAMLPFLYYLRHGLAVGLMLGDIKSNIVLSGAGVDTQVDVTAIGDAGLFVGFGGSLFSDKLHLGMNLKGMVRGGGRKTLSVLDLVAGSSISISPQELGGAGLGVDADLGAIYELPQLFPKVRSFASITISNLLASQFDLVRLIQSTGTGRIPGLNRMLSVGGRVELPGFWKFHNPNFVVDFAEFSMGGEADQEFGARGGNFFKHVNLGAELPMRWFALRGGFRQGNLALGIGLDARFFQLDFATYGEELAENPGRLTSRRYQLRFAMGFGGSMPTAAPVSPSDQKEIQERVKEPQAPFETPVAPAPVKDAASSAAAAGEKAKEAAKEGAAKAKEAKEAVQSTTKGTN